MTDEQKTKIGIELIEVLSIRKNRFGLYITSWGSKTPIGVYKTVKRIMEVKE